MNKAALNEQAVTKTTSSAMLPDKALGVYLTTGSVTERLIVRMRVTRRPASGDNLITITGKSLKTMMPMRMMMIKAMTINVMPCR